MRFRKMGSLALRVYRRAWLAALSGDLRVHRIALERWKAGSEVVFGLNGPMILLPLRGLCKVEPMARSCCHGCGEILLSARAAGSRLTVPGQVDLRLFIIELSGSLVGRFLGQLHVASGFAARRVVPSELSSLLWASIRHGQSWDRREQQVAEAYFRTFLALLGKQILPENPVRSAAFDRFSRIRSMLMESPLRWHSVREAAEETGLCGDTINRLFRRYAGTTFGAFLRQCRMEQAAQWVRQGRMTLETMAGLLGYSDGFALSKAFRRHYGQSPRQWADSKTYD
jgi:AraC-like DNA-binding protein